MRPPHDPAHVERVNFADSKTTDVKAHCSCGWAGERHLLGAPHTLTDLIADLNGHRKTYVQQSA